MFAQEDVNKFDDIKFQTRMVLPMTALSFIAASFIKYKAYFGETNIGKVSTLVILSYAP